MRDDEKLSQCLGERLFQFRQERGLTLLECSLLANLSKAHLSQIEQGKSLPSLDKLLDLAEVLGVNVCDFFVHKAYDFDEEAYDELRRSGQRERVPF